MCTTVISGLFAIVTLIATGLFFKKKNEIISNFNKDLVTHKAELDKKALRIQNDLDRERDILRIEYGKLYEKRLEVIEEIHNKLLDISKIVKILENHSSGIEICEADRQLVVNHEEKLSTFHQYYDSKKIYLSENLTKIIDAFLMTSAAVLFELFSKFDQEKFKEFFKNGVTISDEELKKFQEFSAEFSKFRKDERVTLSEILEAVRNEFRALIGAEIMRS